MITITAKCALIENKKEEFIELAKELVEESNKESGCISYNLYEDIENYNKSDHFKRVVLKLRKLQMEDSIVNLYKKM